MTVAFEEVRGSGCFGLFFWAWRGRMSRGSARVSNSRVRTGSLGGAGRTVPDCQFRAGDDGEPPARLAATSWLVLVVLTIRTLWPSQCSG